MMTMRGVCISFNPRNVGTIWPMSAEAAPPVYAVPADDRPFCFFFRPLFLYLRELYWFATGFQSTPFVRLLREDDGEARLEAAQMDIGIDWNSSILHRPGTLPDLAGYVQNDWLTLIGLRCSADHAIATARRMDEAGDALDAIADEEAEIAFYCVDGFWWEFYPRDQSLLDLVVAPLRGIAGVHLQPCDLRNRRALFGDSVTS